MFQLILNTERVVHKLWFNYTHLNVLPESQSVLYYSLRKDLVYSIVELDYIRQLAARYTHSNRDGYQYDSYMPKVRWQLQVFKNIQPLVELVVADHIWWDERYEHIEYKEKLKHRTSASHAKAELPLSIL